MSEFIRDIRIETPGGHEPMENSHIITIAFGLFSLSVPVMLAFVLNSMRDLHKDIKDINSRLGRIEGRLFDVTSGS